MFDRYLKLIKKLNKQKVKSEEEKEKVREKKKKDRLESLSSVSYFAPMKDLCNLHTK